MKLAPQVNIGTIGKPLRYRGDTIERLVTVPRRLAPPFPIAINEGTTFHAELVYGIQYNLIREKP